MVKPTLKERIRLSFHESATLETVTRFSTSWLLPPIVLCFIRGIISLYAFVVIFTTLGLESTVYKATHAATKSFSYFTILGYWGLAFYFAFAAAHSGSYAIRGQALLAGWPKSLRWLHGVFYATVAVFPFIVTGKTAMPTSTE